MHGEHSSRSLEILAMVYVVAEKSGGDSVQPIVSLLVVVTSFRFLGLFGKGTTRLSAPLSVM